MRTYLLLALLLWAGPAEAAEWGATTLVVGGGPSIELGPALLLPLGRGALHADLTVGHARGYGVRAASATYLNSMEKGWFYGGGLRNEWIVDAGSLTPRVGLAGEFGWQTGPGHRLRVGVKPILNFISIGPALGIGVTYFPFSTKTD